MLLAMLIGIINWSEGDLSFMEALMGILEPLCSYTVQIIIRASIVLSCFI